MKRIITIIMVTISVTALNIVHAQWNQQGGLVNRHGSGAQTTLFGFNTWRSWGFGNFTGNNAPRARVHINDFLCLNTINFANGTLFRTDGSNNTINQWQMFTGVSNGTTTQKFRVFTTLNSSIANGTQMNTENITLEASQRDMVFNAGGNVERMRILGKDHNLNGITPWYAVAKAGNVGIGTAHPLSMLQIGGEAHSGGGWRPWMQIGTYYASKVGADNMYVGLKEVGTDRNEAIIAWGNNPSTNPANADRLRFIFTGAPNNGPASTVNGLEIGRMWANNNGDGRMGIGDFFTAGSDPANTLEIMASPASPYWNSPGGASGLRFTHLKSTATTIPNPGLGVLSVDANGDVIYVSSGSSGNSGAHNGTSMSTIDPTKVALGQNLNQSGNPGQLLNNREIPMNGFNLTFSDNIPSSLNRMGIGTNAPSAKLDVNLTTNLTSSTSSAVKVANSTTSTVANGMEIVVNGNSMTKYGARINVDGSANPSGSNFGTRANLLGGISNQGFHAFCDDASIINVGITAYAMSHNIIAIDNRGVEAQAYQGRTNIGGVLTATNGSSTVYNFGVWGQVMGGSAITGNYAVYGSLYNVTNPANSYAGYFNGDVYASALYLPSDASLKVNVSPMNSALNIINQLNPVTYEYGDYQQSNELNLPIGEHKGFIAQEVAQLIPNAVRDIVHPERRDSLGNVVAPEITFKGLNYTELIPVAIMGIKEQSAKIDSLNSVNSALQIALDSIVSKNNQQEAVINDLNSRLTQLENCLSGVLPFLCQLSHNSIQQNTPQAQEVIRQQLSIYLSNKEAIILDQNVPNPFAEQTVINFSIPESVKSAQIFFYDGMGKLIKTVDIRERGLGSITVFGSDLSSGTYMYTLVADGVKVATKKMVKE